MRIRLSPLVIFATCWFTPAPLHAQPGGTSSKPLTAAVKYVDSPAGPDSMGSSLTTSAEGVTWLSWIESAGEKQNALKCARFDLANQRWGEARLIARGADWFVNWADFPVMAAHGDRLLAVWFVGSPDSDHDHSGYRAEFSASKDGGNTWSKPEPITRDSTSVEFVALQPLSNGHILAAWLDGRGRGAGALGRQALYARLVGESGPDAIVDPSVCDCCQLSLVPTPDGGALLAYRGRSAEEVRDMRVAQYRNGRWGTPRTLHHDGWKIAACPVNGPQLATSGGHVGAVWFTAANNQARVYAARAETSAPNFGEATVVDLGRPLGRVDNVMLSDRTHLIVWLEGSDKEKEGGLYLRTISADGTPSKPALIAPTTTARAGGFPRIVLLRDGPQPQLLLSFTRDGQPRQVVTAVVTAER
ncbi:MAG: hypothetical protein HZA93_08470 [Verrucomicrobia bacterium]|nr:hypothetical protein [Verrucomicrobiota bacterium]